MSKVFIIAEAACTWLHGGLEAAYRSIEAAKACGADAWKSQWTSDPEAMAMRRGTDRDKYTRLAWGAPALPLLKQKCEEVGLEFLCTVFIEKDLPIISQYVKSIKVSAFESQDRAFLNAVCKLEKPCFISVNPGGQRLNFCQDSNWLYCVSKYPCPLEDLRLASSKEIDWDMRGLSDHTTSVLTGAVAAGMGCHVIEKHVRLHGTPQDDPDYGHSLRLDGPEGCGCQDYCPPDDHFKTYVDNIRLAERML